MPIGPYGEIIGTTNCLDGVPESVLKQYRTKVNVPKNPKVVTEDEPKHKLTPSVFMFQMSMDTEKKLANTRDMRRPQKVELLDMSETTHQRFSHVSIDEPLFQPFPSEIFFQKCEPFKTHEVPLILRNNDKVPRLVKVVQADSPYFKIVAPLNSGDKVGPGLPTVYKIQFTPEDRRDYIHELVCITEREKFIVPVTAIGSRALLDFPDNVNFGLCPVKHMTTKTLLVRNVGEREAKFTLTTKKPFSVKPANGILAVNESLQITIEFTPTKTGDHQADLELGYDTGETILIDLYGGAQDSNVRLEKSSVRIENTYLGMAKQRAVTITNRSNVIAHFRWSEFATQESEDMQRTRFIGELTDSEKSETDRFLEECIADPSLRDKMSIINRTFQNRRRNVVDNQMLFSDDVVKIDPPEGDIWPNSAVEITIIFKPDKAETYNRTAFCDITGRESRLPLRVTGLGIGPKVQFSCDSLDMGNIFVGSTHVYEIVMANKGDIDAIYTLIPSKTTFGKCFAFNPAESILMPGAHQAIQVHFSCLTLGNFEEEFEFQVDGAPEKVKVRFVGCVIGPTFHFDVNKIKFGTVSYGFLNTFTCTLSNTALVPMTFSLRVPGDGLADSSSASEMESTFSEAGSLIPKEFEITPSRGTLQPQSDIRIEIDFCSTTLKKYDCSLVVDVEGVGEEWLTLPIEAKCIVPTITVMSPLIDYGRCFLRYPYERSVQLRNESPLPARYELLTQQVDRTCPILYSSSQRKGVIEPNSIREVPLFIEAQGLEELTVNAYFMIVGSQEAPLPVQIMCNGEGPVVHVSPLQLDWGQIPVLTDVVRVITLSNESLVPSKFTAHMIRAGSAWKIEPQQGEIPPEEKFEISLTANVDDVVRFQDKVQINFLESQSRTIPVEAYGFGTTIVTEPKMESYMNIGPHFSNTPCVKKFKITNSGRRLQQLVWSTDGFSLVKPRRDPLYDAKDIRYKNVPAVPEFNQPIFRLSPARMELRPGESMCLTLEGYVSEAREVKERLLCHSIIGRQGGKELIMKIDMYMEFISPLLEFSNNAMFFRFDKMPNASLELQAQELMLKNVSSLPLNVKLDLKYPFSLLFGDEEGEQEVTKTTEASITLEVKESYKLKIQFDPAFKDDFHIRTVDEVLSVSYQEHPHIDYIALRGEVYFPNLAFEKTKVDFGCVLNDTEVTRYVNVTNNSPMDVNYSWSFLVGDEPCVDRRQRFIPAQTYTVVEEEEYKDVPLIDDEIALVKAPEVAEDENAKDLEQEKETSISQPTIEVTGASRTGYVSTAVTVVSGADESAAVARAPSQPISTREERELVTEPECSEPAADTTEAQVPTTLADVEEIHKEPLESEKEMSVASPFVQESATAAQEEVLGEEYQSRPQTRMGPLRTPPAINSTIKALLEGATDTETQLGVEEVFDILPLYGTLKPGETEQITLTFYGHANIDSRAKALCAVEGGPTYELDLFGESSLVEYRFDATEIDYGKQMYDQVACSEITLLNKGRVGFEFEALNMEPSATGKPDPGSPLLIPHKGYIEPLSEMVLAVKFLPGIPDKFQKTFKIQVAHFEPEDITVFCEGIFPRITLDLPRHEDSSGAYKSLLQQAKDKLTVTSPAKADVLVIHHEDMHYTDNFTDVSPRPNNDNVAMQQPSDIDLQTEIERLTVTAYTHLAAQSQTDEMTTLQNAKNSKPNGSKNKTKRRKNKPTLPDYVLDFGHVILGTVRTHIVRVTNPGLGPVSFSVDHNSIADYGFNVELDRVKQLPGAPDHEPIDFVVSFDPRGANLSLEPVECVVPINIINGPQVNMRLKANVTMPDMEISSDVLEFGEVICGKCQIITVQLHNHKHVRCEWSSLPTEKELREQSSNIDKHVPMHLRRKMKPEKPKPKTFELMPSTGVLMPGQRVNIQVKFMPTEERAYEQRLTVRLAQSSQRIMVMCRGHGQEPRLEFNRNLVEFGPVLPHSVGDEQDVVVKNPCDFPIEFYSLESDRQYLEEEKILRLMKGWDEYNTILLPPRPVNERLPEELTNFYEEQVKKVEESEQAKREEAEAVAANAAEASAADIKEGEATVAEEITVPVITTIPPSADVAKREGDEDDDDDDEDKIRESLSSVAFGDLEVTPVSAAIARHLGIDLTPDGKAARNRRGVALVVHGAPMSGKTTTAIQLAKRYSAALLTIDGVVLEAISNGNTAAGRRARDLCAETAKRKAEEMKAVEAEEADKKLSGGLSMEAVQAHTAGQAAVAGVHSNTQSLVSNRKTSSMAGAGKDKHPKLPPGAQHAVGAAMADASSNSQVPMSPPPLAAPIARRLSISASVVGEEGLFSCVLPEELVVEIIADRVQLNDCHSGVVFDGLESLFCLNMYSAANCILKAFNNRKYLFFVTLKLDYAAMKAQEKKEQEDKELKLKQEEEAEKLRLEEMDEDEYDALSEQQKAQIDKKRLEIKRERRKREQEERLERERQEKERQEAEARRQEEEKAARKKNKNKDGKDEKAKDAKQAAGAAKGKAAPAADRAGNIKSQSGNKAHEDGRPESHMTHGSGEDMDKKKKGKLNNRPISNEVPSAPEELAPAKESITEAERLLMQRFKTFEVSLRDITELVERWDRTIGAPRPLANHGNEAEDTHHSHPQSGRKVKNKDKGDKHGKHESIDVPPKAAELAESETAEGEDQTSADPEGDGIGVATIVVDVANKSTQPAQVVLQCPKLPAMDEVMDGLGLGVKGPPIPPMADFAVIPYPVKRKAPISEAASHYVFIASGPDDPNVLTDDKSKEDEEEKAGTPDGKVDATTPTGKKKDRGSKEKQKEDKDKRKTSAGKGKSSTIGRRGSNVMTTPPPGGALTPGSEADAQSSSGEMLIDGRSPKLNSFRWTVPAKGEVTLRLRFFSEELGQYDQTMNFEIVGTRRRYQMYCRGICAFPTISREPRIVFPARVKTKKADDILHKEYVLSSDVFEFGPLLAGQNRETMKANRFPEHNEKLTILNTSPLEAEMSFCYLDDSRGDCFMLDPPTMTLKPGEQEVLNIYAFPRSRDFYEDSLICCIKENPEPVIFKVNCHGCRPELEVDKKTLQFDKVLLHRKDTKTLFLRNRTLIPVGWRLSGMENLGDDFSVSEDSGIVQPHTEFALQAHFRATKPVTTNRKSIRLEILDSDDQYGIVEAITIHVHAEAYDVALDMSFPKGTDGGIDFGTVKVGEEGKNQLTLKNKGRYEISYSFSLENASGQNLPDVASLFVVQPQKGTLTSTDRPSTVQISFKSNTEITIKDLPILRCQVIEPNVAEGGETIASIPVKLTVKSVFSRYTVAPKADINFGALLVNFKKMRTFTIENNGTFDFKYSIVRAAKEVKRIEPRIKPTIKAIEKMKSRDGSSSGKASALPGSRAPKRADSIRQEVGTTGGGGGGGGQSRLQLGMFTIFPAFGIVLPNGHATVTVDCAPEVVGKCEEDLSIDIGERDPSDQPRGIPYKLLAEACVPGINIMDIGAIFEEHRICRSLNLWQQTTTVDVSSVYGEEENKFLFNNVVVGRKAKARFKLSNVQKVPCDLTLAMKPLAVKYGSKTVECFEIEPRLKLNIPAHSHTYATVIFTPTAMQHYTAVFEASIDGVPASQAKTRNLSFEVAGDGNLPRISILRPIIRNKKGQPLLLFKKNLIKRRETLPFIIANEGSLISKVYIDLIDPDGVFTLVPTGESRAFITDGYDDNSSLRKPHTCSVLVNVGERATFDVSYMPKEVGRTQATVQLTVEDNQYEDSVVQLVGEGYQDDVTLDNLHSVVQDTDVQYEDGSMADDDIAAAKSNLIKFGDSAVGESKTLTFSMTNHSTTECIKFVWPEHPAVRFSPMCGHIHAGLHKDMTVTFQASEPMNLSEESIQCSVTRITFDKDISEVSDWDDRLRTVKWTDAVGPNDRPAKRKVVEVEPEPVNNEVADSARSVELLVSANADFSKFKCKTELIKFKDTLMFQSRVYEVQLQNKGSIRMDYNWQVMMEDFMQLSRSVTFAAETTAGSRCGSMTPSVVGEVSLHMPFTVEPAFGSILPGKKADIQVKFSPLDLNDYDARLVCTIPNLEEAKQGPVIALKGKSLLPYCHFELSDSDYLSSARRNPEMRGPRGAPPGTTLDSNTRVIEMHSVGVGMKNTKRFTIVNPTTEAYCFQWLNDDDPDLKVTQSFSCATPSGQINSGKKQEIQFNFVPHNLGITESFWVFRIPEQNISVPFLLMGETKDPAVMFDRSHLNFKALLIGHEAMETVYMVNNETQPFYFNFEESSFFSAGYKDRLKVVPRSGYIPPESRIQISLFFTPQADYEVNFNIVCGVKRKVEPLRLNVKAEGYCMNAMVVCEDSMNSNVELTSQGVNAINLGSVEINEESMRTITIFNAGKFNFDYRWELTERSARGGKSVSITPASGAIGFEDNTQCVLSFMPKSRMTLVGCELVLKIAHGPKYLVNVTGNGVAPAIHFSFQQHNFGPCFIYRAGMPTHSVVLRATNRDKKDVSLDCLFESTQYLHHDFEAQVIPANHAVNITFSFYPREAKKYRESIEFEINGLSREKVEILGVGTEMKVEVVNPIHKNTRLGALRIGQVVKKQIQLINNSPSSITFQLSCTPSTPELQDRSILRITPTQAVTLPAKGGTCKVDVVFSPKSRIPQFAEEVMMECAGMFQPVFVLSGCCQGLEIGLDADAIAFGTVVQKSQSSRKLVMSNTGDIGARFKWDASKFQPDFSISPTAGYISPGMDVTFEVLFHPLDINSDIRYEKLRCIIEDASPLRLTLTGMCSGVPAFKEVQHFSSHVRNKEAKNLMIINRTNQLWQLKPIIDGEYWSGADWFVVEPQQQKPYELTYYPLMMTHENRKHQGTIFFPLPDGNGLLYNLVGTATEPKVSSRITRDVPCKTNAVELLPVTNWLKKPQRFRVKIEAMRPDKFDVGTTVKGLDYIDVPPHGKRDYKVNFYAHKEGITMCKVSFTNEATSEYQWVEVGFKAVKGGPLDQIKLTTPVRQSTQYSLVVKNPLATHVTFTATCSINEVALPSQISVPAESEGLLTLEFLPLTTRVQNGKIELNNADLGVYLYELECTATPAGPEKALYFKCPLGSHQTLPARFLNFAKQKTEYTCKLENTTDFSSEKTLNAAPASAGGTETSVELNFEPSRIGEIRTQLVISSPVGGEYVFPIFATCVPPKPQGPFVIKSGSTTYITFRNNFPNTTAFTFTVDNPAFHVSKGGDNIRGKKDHRIVIGYDGTDSGTRAPVMGKLIVSCARSAGGSTPAQWVYYLKGVMQESK